MSYNARHALRLSARTGIVESPRVTIVRVDEGVPAGSANGAVPRMSSRRRARGQSFRVHGLFWCHGPDEQLVVANPVREERGPETPCGGHEIFCGGRSRG